MSTTARVETRGDGVVVLHLAVPGGAHVELPMGRGEAHELGSLLLDAGDEPAPLLPTASPGDVQVFAAGGRVQTRVVGEGPPSGFQQMLEEHVAAMDAVPELAKIAQAMTDHQVSADPAGESLPGGPALDAERAGRCGHDTIWYDDEDDVTRCGACRGPIPASMRRPR